MERVTIESSEGRPWSVVVTTADGVEHRFVRSDDARASALKAAHDGYDRGYANGLRDVARANPQLQRDEPGRQGNEV